jgi:hypothetical protein
MKSHEISAVCFQIATRVLPASGTAISLSISTRRRFSFSVNPSASKESSMLPIKELIIFGFASIGIIAATGGPLNLRANLRNAQIQMIREVGKTSTWGDPLPWHARNRISYKKRTISLSGKPHCRGRKRGTKLSFLRKLN